MRLLSLKINDAQSCGGILDGLSINFTRSHQESNQPLSPICILGPNGSGKSQFLQILAEIFQAAWHTHAPKQERSASNKTVLFELYYEIALENGTTAVICLERNAKTKPKGAIEMTEKVDGEWEEVLSTSPEFGDRLPPAIVGYTSGDNETLSLPFFVSRAGYAKDVSEAAKKPEQFDGNILENRLLHVDYATHLEVLIANLIRNEADVEKALLEHAGLDSLYSCRCTVQLDPATGPTKGIKITEELESVLHALKSASTCWNYAEKKQTYIFDFFVDSESKTAFKAFFKSAEDLYRSFHKLAMLNDLAISKTARTRFDKDIKKGQFAARLPEPQDEDKVFHFEHVKLKKRDADNNARIVDYVSLSDGEHQQAQVLGLFAMLKSANTLFILDEPESHFNPQWRVEFVKSLLELPGDKATQEVVLTSHAPFVASDISRENVLIFSKDENSIQVRKPDIETYGATFDRILEHCFEIAPPISALAKEEIEHLKSDGSVEELEEAMSRLGSSVEKAILADRLRRLKS